MQKSTLGNSDLHSNLHSNLEVSAFGLGCMGMNYAYRPDPDKREMISLTRSVVAPLKAFCASSSRSTRLVGLPALAAWDEQRTNGSGKRGIAPHLD